MYPFGHLANNRAGFQDPDCCRTSGGLLGDGEGLQDESQVHRMQREGKQVPSVLPR